MFLIDDIPLAVGVAFNHNGISFPSNWAQLFTAEDKAQYNIIEVPDPEPFNERFYWGPNNPKNLSEIKAMLIRQIKESTGNSLSSTSWMVERFNDPTSRKPIPQNVLDYRTTIRTMSDEYEVQINEAMSVDELAVMNFIFPELT
jgi:hypothetical protein